MTDTQAENRQNRTPYASLRSATDGEAAKARNDAPVQTAPAEPDYLTVEADKLEGFKQALYAAFIAAPKSGIPTALVDLAATYTSALRLQLTLRGFSTMPKTTVKAPLFGAPRTK
jgi:hypothetical protein